MLSKWHVHAEEYARFLNSLPGCAVTCVWDEEPARGEAWARELKAAFEPDLNALLARPDVDGVIVTTPTSLHRKVMVAAANAGKHIFTEKVLALTTEDALAVKSAVEMNDVRFCISFPQRTMPEYLFAKKAVEEGLLGDVTMMRVRNGHNGAIAGWLPEYWYDPQTAGGGAMMDLGCHPMYLSRWILGRPVSVQSTFASYTGRAVEDSAVCILTFENKAVAVVETSLSAYYAPYLFEVYGTEGTLLIKDRKLELKCGKYGGETRRLGVEDCPAALRPAVEQWVRGCTAGEPIAFGMEDAVELTRMMEAAYLAHREKRAVFFR